jgi:arabinofuranosyltransferase
MPRHLDPAARVGTVVGKHIARSWPAGSLVALNTAGAIPFYATNHRYIDMLGINDKHIARRRIVQGFVARWQPMAGHEKGDGAYVLSRSPDYIIVGPAQGSEINQPWFLSDFEMMQDPRFSRDYRVRKVRLDEQGLRTKSDGLAFTYYMRR